MAAMDNENTIKNDKAPESGKVSEGGSEKSPSGAGGGKDSGGKGPGKENVARTDEYLGKYKDRHSEASEQEKFGSYPVQEGPSPFKNLKSVGG